MVDLRPQLVLRMENTVNEIAELRRARDALCEQLRDTQEKLNALSIVYKDVTGQEYKKEE